MSTTIIFDADDTLWENNRFYEEATEELDALAPCVGIRKQLAQWQHDYPGCGSVYFAVGLISIGLENGIPQDVIAPICDKLVFTQRLVFPDVLQVLKELRFKNLRLLLLTGGCANEQTVKLFRSGLLNCFDGISIVPVKTVQSYSDLVVRFGLLPELTWMVGNSQRFDINPALGAGFNAVHLVRPDVLTWGMDAARPVLPAPGRQCMTIKYFAELLDGPF